MKKIVLILDLHDNKAKQKAMKAVSTLAGIDSIAMDMKEGKLTVIGAVDPVDVVSKLRKTWRTEIFSVGPAKEPEKKEEAAAEKKEEPKKEEPKKEEAEKKEAEKKEETEKKKEEAEKKKEHNEPQMIFDLVNAYKAYNPYMTTHYYVHSAEENPNSCVIC